MPAFAYLFERFPAYTQTFCYREVLELARQGVGVPIYSIHSQEGADAGFPKGVKNRVEFLPDAKHLHGHGHGLRAARRLPRKAKKLFKAKERKDFARVFEALWLGPRLKEQGVHHVHVHFAGLAARTAYWLKQFYGITYSVTGHANDMFCETGHPVALSDIMREAALVATETEFTKRWLLERFPEASRKIHRVYNGIAAFDEEAREDAFSAEAFEQPHIVSVGRCIIKKGYEDLIAACALLRDRGVAFRCSIVGDGLLFASLQEQIEALGLGGIVKMKGAMPQNEVQAVLATAQLFVLACAPEPDGGMDNFPTVIAEAMVRSLPVVSTHLAGVPEMVIEGETGLLVAPQDREGLACAMEALLRDRERARAYGLAGRERAVREFAIENTARHLISLLDTCPQACMPRSVVGEKSFGTKVKRFWRKLLGSDGF